MMQAIKWKFTGFIFTKRITQSFSTILAISLQQIFSSQFSTIFYINQQINTLNKILKQFSKIHYLFFLHFFGILSRILFKRKINNLYQFITKLIAVSLCNIFNIFKKIRILFPFYSRKLIISASEKWDVIFNWCLFNNIQGIKNWTVTL